MQVPSFIRSFKCFMSRIDIPGVVVSNDFKTFQSTEVKRFMLQDQIILKSILPASPWNGGFYKWLVRSVKISIGKMIFILWRCRIFALWCRSGNQFTTISLCQWRWFKWITHNNFSENITKIFQKIWKAYHVESNICKH